MSTFNLTGKFQGAHIAIGDGAEVVARTDNAPYLEPAVTVLRDLYQFIVASNVSDTSGERSAEFEHLLHRAYDVVSFMED